MKYTVLRNLLSGEECDELVAKVKELQSRQACATIQRDPDGKHTTIGTWKTSYLHSGGCFPQYFPDLKLKLRKATVEADAESWGLLRARDLAKVNYRTVEFHVRESSPRRCMTDEHDTQLSPFSSYLQEYSKGGRLNAERHYDAGSIITMDIMLSEPGKDFTGGELCTPEADGSVQRVDFRRGDAALFVSHKFHNVRPVEQGRRTVLVLELWDGPEKTCAHRCLTTGPCSYSLSQAQISNAGHMAGVLG